MTPEFVDMMGPHNHPHFIALRAGDFPRVGLGGLEWQPGSWDLKNITMLHARGRRIGMEGMAFKTREGSRVQP